MAPAPGRRKRRQFEGATRCCNAQWKFSDRDAPWDRHTGAIGILKLMFFVPEPSRWLLLAAGLGCLGVLYRVRGSKFPKLD